MRLNGSLRPFKHLRRTKARQSSADVRKYPPNEGCVSISHCETDAFSRLGQRQAFCAIRPSDRKAQPRPWVSPMSVGHAPAQHQGGRESDDDFPVFVENPMSRGFASDVIFNGFPGKIARDGIQVDVDLESFDSLAPDQAGFQGRNRMRNGDLHEKRFAHGCEDDVRLVSVEPLLRCDINQFDLGGIDHPMSVPRYNRKLNAAATEDKSLEKMCKAVIWPVIPHPSVSLPAGAQNGVSRGWYEQ